MLKTSERKTFQYNKEYVHVNLLMKHLTQLLKDGQMKDFLHYIFPTLKN